MVIFMKKRAIVAMSGGVDSSVAAYLIKKQDYECIGVTLKLFNNEDIDISREKTCCSLDDIEDARNIADNLDIPYYVFNFTDTFKTDVIDRFANAYKCGFTPNPCIDCNRYIKFERLIDRANQLQFEYVATGHYAIIEQDKESGRFLLKKAVDETKDQSYVLYSLTQDQLSKTLFPLGHLKKSEVREIALENGFINAKKHDSQDICFIKNGNYAQFIEEYLGEKFENGNFVDYQGNILGEHKGIIRYTVGQRKGLGISNTNPLYVCKKDIENNTIVVGEKKELYTKSLFAKDINLIAYKSIEKPIRVKAKIRYKHKEQWATLEQISENRVDLEFDSPQPAITMGQAVVFYDGDIVIGGGTIE